jgi:hypothetical protein
MFYSKELLIHPGIRLGGLRKVTEYIVTSYPQQELEQFTLRNEPRTLPLCANLVCCSLGNI